MGFCFDKMLLVLLRDYQTVSMLRSLDNMGHDVLQLLQFYHFDS